MSNLNTKIIEEAKRSIGNVAREGGKIESEFRQKVAGYITAAFGLVVGLAWNDAIKSLIEYWFPLDKNSITVKFVYALAMTVVLVILSSYLIRIFKKDNK